ncbi:hypothetical protein Pmar_PMAR017239, partial [Perkinsus marinus ATCC 50983]
SPRFRGTVRIIVAFCLSLEQVEGLPISCRIQRKNGRYWREAYEVMRSSP